ncbi:MAG: hypothetical protein ACT4QD_04955 [Acidobacteriota bacterium]
MRAATVVVMFVALHAGVVAQRNQPVYPAYDGYVKNADGSYTVAFAYFSHNADEVTIDPGPGNAFAPAPADRQQPTRFRPGHWRFQCVMVLGPDFDGKLQWQLTYAGTTTGTSERMLQSNWNLVEGAAELSRIDFKSAPRGVCLNRAPTLRLLGKTARKGEVSIDATTSEELHLFGSVADEGLPRGRPLIVTWRVVKGPGTVSFSSASTPRTTAQFSLPGTYELELAASDSEFSASLRVIVSVSSR